MLVKLFVVCSLEIPEGMATVCFVLGYGQGVIVAPLNCFAAQHMVRAW